MLKLFCKCENAILSCLYFGDYLLGDYLFIYNINLVVRGGIIKFQGLGRYMVQDLLVLTIIGGALEVFTTKFATVVFNGTPFCCISLLIMFIAVARWNFGGLIIAPILALMSFLGGIWSEAPKFAAVYDWHMYIATFVGLLMMGLNGILFIKFSTRKIVSSPIYLVLLMLVDYALVCVIQFVVYRLLCSGTLTHAGEIMFDYYHTNATTGAKELVSVNVCNIGENVFVYNLFGLVILVVGVFIFRSQGVVCNVKQKFVDDKQNAELDEAFKKFSIEEVSENVSGEADSEKEIDSKDNNQEEKGRE